MFGAGAVVALGGAALTDMQQESDIQRTEHLMTQLDAHAAQVALASTDVQTVDIGGQEGSYSVRPSAATIAVTPVNFDGTTTQDGDEVDDGSGDEDEQVYSGSLGAVVYRTGETTIANQGSGIWRKGPTGEARMVAPPEVHYRGGTLTLPVVRTTGTASAAGDVTATVKTGRHHRPGVPGRRRKLQRRRPARSPLHQPHLVGLRGRRRAEQVLRGLGAVLPDPH